MQHIQKLRLGMAQLGNGQGYTNADLFVGRSVLKISSIPLLKYTVCRFPRGCSAMRLMSTRAKLGSQTFKIVERLRLKDKVPKNYELIYRSAFPNYMIAVQVFNILSFGLLATTIAAKLVEIYATDPNSESSDADTKLQTVTEPIPDQNLEKFSALQENLRGYFGFNTMETEEAKLPKPSFDEVLEGGLETYALFAVALVVFTISFIRLQRRSPIRIYTSPSGHSVGVFYGHVIPGMLTRREFLAGSLKSLENPRGILWSKALYEDGSGHKMILFEHSFRYQADFNRLLGIQNSYEDDDTIDIRGVKRSSEMKKNSNYK